MPLFEPIGYKNYILVDGCFKDNLPIAPLKIYDKTIVSIDLQPDFFFQKDKIYLLLQKALLK